MSSIASIMNSYNLVNLRGYILIENLNMMHRMYLNLTFIHLAGFVFVNVYTVVSGKGSFFSILMNPSFLSEQRKKRLAQAAQFPARQPTRLVLECGHADGAKGRPKKIS